MQLALMRSGILSGPTETLATLVNLYALLHCDRIVGTLSSNFLRLAGELAIAAGAARGKIVALEEMPPWTWDGVESEWWCLPSEDCDAV